MMRSILKTLELFGANVRKAPHHDGERIVAAARAAHERLEELDATASLSANVLRQMLRRRRGS